MTQNIFKQEEQELADEAQPQNITVDPIDQYLPKGDVLYLKKLMSQDEIWALVELRRIKEHGFGQLTAQVNEGQVVQLDTTERRRNLSTLTLSMA